MAEASEAVLYGVLDAPEIYIDGYQGAMVGNGVVKLNCFSAALDPVSGETIQICVARLAMSVPNLLGFHEALGQLIGLMQGDGLIASENLEKPDA